MLGKVSKIKFLGLLLVLTALAMVMACGSEDPTAAPTVKPTAMMEPTANNTPTPTNLGFGPGTYRVGSDIQPGLYEGRTGIGMFDDSCYWERLRGYQARLPTRLPTALDTGGSI